MNKLNFILFLCCFPLTITAKPELLLAQVYHDNIDVQQYWVSEKLDGVRAFWNGTELISRGGNVITAPAWFVADFPVEKLDGELWSGHNQFAEILSTVSKQQAIDTEWQAIRYFIFELPDAGGTFTERISAMNTLIQRQSSPYLKVIPQFRIAGHTELFETLHRLESIGAEGLMLHHQDALYKTGRSYDLLKLKTYQDTEAVVIGYRPGKGKYLGMVGALVVRTPEGKTFAIGSGLTDELRQTPPEIGAVITYRYNGLTKNGLPRFARFLRLREAF